MIIFQCMYYGILKRKIILKNDLMNNVNEMKAIPVETKITNCDFFLYSLNTSQGLREKEKNSLGRLLG